MTRPDSPEAIARRGSVAFLPSFAALQGAVRMACAGEARWEARVVAGIGAVIAFTLADPDAVRALTWNARDRATEAGNPEEEVLSYFEELLVDTIPNEMPFAISGPGGVVEAIAIVVRGNLLSGTTERLRDLGPDLVFLALTPYLGLGGATQWAQTFSLPQSLTVD